MLLLGLLTIWATHQGLSQQLSQVSVALMTESIALPLTRISPLHPGAEVGLEWTVKENPKGGQSFHAYIGGFYHERVETSIYIRGDYTWAWQPHTLIRAELSPGLGYMHTFYPSDLYKLNEAGEHEKATQTGRSHLLAELGVGLVFFNEARISPFVKTRLAVETPFANGIPIIPHSFLQVGTSIKL